LSHSISRRYQQEASESRSAQARGKGLSGKAKSLFKKKRKRKTTFGAMKVHHRRNQRHSFSERQVIKGNQGKGMAGK